jgi:hypothetical protein
VSIVGTDVLYKLSITSGAAGNAAAQPDPNASLGKYVSTTAIVDATVNNLFDNVSGDENAASVVDYRLFFVHNNHATLTMLSPVIYIQSETASGASISIGADTTAASAKASAAAQALTIANETTAPAGVTFSAPTTKAGGISLGDIPAGQVKGVWVRRTAANTAAVDLDGAVLKVEWDTAA